MFHVKQTPKVPSRVRPLRLAVAGTGTAVGKTHAAVAITAALVAHGKIALGLKPIESGWLSAHSDGTELANVSAYVPQAAPYRFTEPVSPHLAARRAGIVIQFEAIDAWLARHPADIWLIESAGGLLSPLGPGCSNLDWIGHLCPDVLWLVALDRLGVLHDVSACRVALQSSAQTLPEPWVILQSPEHPDDSTGTNAAELESLGLARVAGCFPYSAPTSPACRVVAEHIIEQCVSRETSPCVAEPPAKPRT